MSNNKVIVLDAANVARGLVAELVQYYLPKDYELSMSVEDLQREVVQALVETVDGLVESSRDSLVRKTGSKFEFYIESGMKTLCEEKLNLNPHFMVDLLMENIGAELLFQRVEEFVKGNRFNIYSVLATTAGTITIELLGDYRILEWERDHLVDGVYHAKPVD